VEREGPGLFEEAIRARGWTLRLCRPWAGEPLPEADRADQILLVLGGPMGIVDLDDPACPWLRAVVGLLQQRLAGGLPVLGICLGAQLLAHAAGGSVRPLAAGDPPLVQREVGFGAIHLAPAGRTDPVLRGLAPCEMVLHWHGDRILLPPQATLLASTLPCAEQCFRLGARAYGLQFHVEVTGDALERWLREDAAFVRAARGPAGVERIRAEAADWLPLVTPRWRLLIDNLLERLDPSG
jgi:GMP synthase-like glutamine amidotransferase